MPEIVIKFNDKVIERVVTEKKRISIGRTNENDIVLENRGVSRKHAQIEFNSDSAVIIDNESLNGTFVNNRRISEELLRDQDCITIGKYILEYHQEQPAGENRQEMDGTMLLKTKQQKKLLQADKVDREIVTRVGSSVILGLENCDISQVPLENEITTIGKAQFVHIKARGMMLSGIQAKIVRENDNFVIVNLGHKGKTKINGAKVDQAPLKNGDIIQVGKSTFRFIEERQ